MSTKAQMQQLFVAWCRSKKIRRPDRPEQMRALALQFSAELQARAMQHMDVLHEFGEDPPLIDAYNADTHVLRTDGGVLDISQEEHEADDFTDMTRERAESLEEAGGDDLAREVIYRDKVRARRKIEAPYARINPPSAQDQPLGVQGIVDPTLNAFKLLAEWQGEPDEVLPVTITLAVPGVLPTGLTTDQRPYAVITWGTRQFSAVAEVDWLSGIQLTVNASGVTVQGALDAPQAGFTAAPMNLEAMIGFYPIVRTGPATRTRYIDGIAAGQTSQTTNIPPFARYVSVWRQPIAEAINIRFKDSNGSAVYTYLLAANTVQTEPIPLSGDIVQIDVVDTGGAGVNFVRLIFGLGL